MADTPSPLEQRRERLRAFADRVLEAVEALPMPKTAVEGERTLRTITAADRMLIQIYSKASASKQSQPLVSSTPACRPYDRSARVSIDGSATCTPAAPDRIAKEPAPAASDAPYDYAYDDDDIDTRRPDTPRPAPETTSALDLEQRAKALYKAYYDSLTAPWHQAHHRPALKRLRTCRATPQTVRYYG
ncbi:hypothetical protein [Asticcacaulis sp. MM231]|uniref:hypothetical protein n=1 Tax=Asticcacaulis sp. MM231 TaxID=3157666 RepID=UPI0032D59A1F